MLSPQDIQNQQFHVRFRGFDPEEVDEFLEQAAAAVQELVEENKELKERLETAERRVAAYKRQEKSAMSAIISAQNVAQEMKEKAREEAREVLAKAREEAKGLEESAGREISDLEREVDRLKEIKTRVREEMRLVLESYLARLDDDEVDHPAPPSLPASPATADGPALAAGAGAMAGAGDELYQRIELTDDLLPREEQEPTGRPTADQKPEPEPKPKPELKPEPEPEPEDKTSLAGAAATSATPPSPPKAREKPVEAEKAGEPEEEQGSLPDLDGDMVFNLEDPLDEEEEAAAEQDPASPDHEPTSDADTDDELSRGPVIDIDDEPEPDPDPKSGPQRP